MENVTLPNVLAFVGWVLGGIILANNGWKAIVDIVRTAKAPNAEQDNRINKLEKRMTHVEECLDNDNERLETMGEDNRIIQRSLLALLDHGIDGNNIDQMRHAKEELQNHLINR